MKTPPTQFGVRENTASPRQHDLRLAADVHSNSIRTEQKDLNAQISPPETESQATGSETALNAALQRATTGEIEVSQFLTVGDVAAMLQVPVSWVYGRMRKRSTDRLPGYRLGKYWRFREEEILAWVQRRRGGVHVA